MKHFTKYLLLVCFSFFIKETICQNNVGIGTLAPANDAVLELKSTNQGMLVPRLSTLQRLAIPTPSNGLLVYDTNYNCFYYYNAPAAVWNSMCAGPSAPTAKANVQMYSSKGVSTLINDTNFITVNGLSVTVTLVDTATINLTSNGTIIWKDSTDEVFTSDVQLYQNSLPIMGTEQSSYFTACCYWPQFKYPQKNLIWSVSTVIPSLPPRTYLFELKARIPPNPMPPLPLTGFYYYAACNHIRQNQGIITAEVIY
ncbi:MAG TPA: hypothetical protein VNZ45_07365 [Bacteroidia bacterium]|jgi:hypothetical protein|nr:hypothetical protein [Bacteroidia bacterium]